MNQTNVNFTVEPNFVVETFRSYLVEENDYNLTLEKLLNSAPSLNKKDAEAILSGSHTFSEDNNEVYLSEDNSDSSKRFLKNMKFIYRNYISYKNNFYKIYAVVTDLGYIDCYSSKSHKDLTQVFIDTYEEIDEEFLDKVKNKIDKLISKKRKQIEDNIKRALHYANNPKEDFAIPLNVDGEAVYLLCTKFEGKVSPIVNIENDLNKAYKKFYEQEKNHFESSTNIRGFKEFYKWYIERKKVNHEGMHGRYILPDGNVTDYEEYIYEYESKKFYQKLKKQILINSNVEKHGWIELYHEKRMVAKVPKLPFLHWCFAYINGNHLIPSYESVSPLGMKLNGSIDNPHHTDWMIGGNLDLERDYRNSSPIQEAAYKKKKEIQKEYLNFETTVLVDPKKVATGTVLICTPDNASEVEDGNILILPDSSDVYDEHVRKATKSKFGGVIAITGSKVVHMAVVSREFDIIMMHDPDSLNKYRNGMTLTLDPSRGKVIIEEYGTRVSLDKNF